jgi:hypothetical protein
MTVTQQLSQMPALHVTEIQFMNQRFKQSKSVSIEKRNIRVKKRNDSMEASLESSSLNMISNPTRDHHFNSNPNILVKDQDTFPELSQALPEEVHAFMDSDSLRNKNWLTGMPLSEKYLIIAAYLASVNTKESDDYVFAGKKQGTRKKVSAGHDDDIAAEVALIRGNSGSRTFKMDRLTSIFAQIASTGGVEKLGGGARAARALGLGGALTDRGEYTVSQITHSYGDVDLFQSIMSMEQRKILIRMPGWTLQQPLYISTVTDKTAEQISFSLSFNLQGYIKR